MTKEGEKEIIIGLETGRENQVIKHLNQEESDCNGNQFTVSDGGFFCSSCGEPVVIGSKSNPKEQDPSVD